MDDQDFYVLALLGNYDHLSSNTSENEDANYTACIVNSSRVYPITNARCIG